MRFLIYIAFIVFISNCQNSHNVQPKREIIYQPKYAKNFVISKIQNDLYLEVIQEEDTIQRVKLNFDNPKITAISQTYIAYLENLSSLQNLKGITYANYLQYSKILELLNNKSITNVGNENIDIELLVKSESNLVLTYPKFNFNSSVLSKDYNIKTVFINEHLETHPLGRAEWLIAFGYILNKQDLANENFEYIESQYLSVKKEIEDANFEQKNILTGELFGEAWISTQNNSYIAQIIKDAKGKLLIDNKGTGSTNIDFEKIIKLQSKVDYWVFATNCVDSCNWNEILKKDTRYKILEIPKSKIHICNTNKTSFFQKSAIHPHLILSDFYKIFHSKKEGLDFHYFYPLL